MAKLKLEDVEKSIREKGAKWKAKENHISLMEEKEQKRLLGAKKPDKLDTASVEAPTAELIAEFALEVDWRASGNVTPVKDQGQCGSCVSFGSLAVLESMVSIEKALLVDLSEADQHFCSSHGATCDGWWHTTAFQQIVARGVCDEACFPYASAFVGGNTGTAPTCKLCTDRASRTYLATTLHSFTNNTDLKNYLSTTGPVAGVIAVYADFYNYGSGVYSHTTGTLQGYHCIAIVGYSEAEQCWICKNSWNTGWGDRGYFKLAYGQVEIDNYEKIGLTGVIIPGTPPPPPPPQEILTVTPTSRTVTQLAGKTTFDVVASGTWTATSNVSWCTVSQLGGVLTATYTANTTRFNRTTTITIKGTTLTVIATVTQQKFIKKK